MPAQLAEQCGQTMWNSVRWGKIYFELGRLEQPWLNKTLVPARQAHGTNQGRTPFICTGRGRIMAPAPAPIRTFLQPLDFFFSSQTCPMTFSIKFLQDFDKVHFNFGSSAQALQHCSLVSLNMNKLGYADQVHPRSNELTRRTPELVWHFRL